MYVVRETLMNGPFITFDKVLIPYRYEDYTIKRAALRSALPLIGILFGVIPCRDHIRSSGVLCLAIGSKASPPVLSGHTRQKIPLRRWI